MILDAFTQVSTAQNITGSAVSLNSMDLTPAGITVRDIGRGAPIVMRVTVTTAFVGAGIMQIGPILATNPDLTGSVHVGAVLGANALGALLAADLPLGASFELTVPAIPEHLLGGLGGLRYLGAIYTLLGGAFAPGAVTTSFFQGIGGNKPRVFPRAYTGP